MSVELSVTYQAIYVELEVILANTVEFCVTLSAKVIELS